MGVGWDHSTFLVACSDFFETIDSHSYKEEYRMVTVFDHKTVDARGPARILFSTSLYSWFRLFIYNIRNKYYGLPTGSNSPIFVTHMGNIIKSKNISGRLSSLLAKVIKEIKSGKTKMNNTLIHNSIQTFVRREHKDLKEAVSNHHEKTTLFERVKRQRKPQNLFPKRLKVYRQLAECLMKVSNSINQMKKIRKNSL